MKQAQIVYRYIITVLIIFSSIISFNCKKNPLTPTPSGPDTTSHNFTWQSTAFGGAATSSFQDVAIINDSLAIAVGQIFMYDSTGVVDPHSYCLAVWDGQKWTLRRLYDADNHLMPLLRGIFTFSSADIWLTDGGVHRWDGKSRQVSITFDRIALIGGQENFQSVNKVWGTNSTDLYGVGYKGMITHFDGNSWQKIPSGIDFEISDIFGAFDPKTGKQQILASAFQDNPPERAIFTIQGNTSTQISPYPIQPLYEFFSLWFIPNQHYYVVGDGIYEKKLLSDSLWKNNSLDITRHSTTKIRGNGLNDVFAVGSFGDCLHWNGESWKSYINQTGLSDGSYGSVAIKGNLVIAVGMNNNQGVITIGRR
ncbi:MAG: glucosyl transferase [Ignavibacteriaceae bacterium]|nr:glucosyl transferase [Ignavibacteriaceae bacterium]